MVKKLPSVLLFLALMIGLNACSSPPNPTATIETTLGSFEVEVFLNEIPELSKNFIELSKQGLYDGAPFHRVVPGFVIQGGDFENKDGRGGYSYKGRGTYLPGEYAKGISNVRGTLSMANARPDRNGSQFFINLRDNLMLDYDKEPLTSQHPVFGKVIKGMEVVDTMAGVELEGETPIEPILIKKVTIHETE